MMTTIHDEAYYREMKDKLMDKYSHFPDLEWDLKILTRKYRNLPEPARQEAIRTQAMGVVESCENWLRSEKRRFSIAKERKILIQRDVRERFEFTCYCLANFKKAHGLAWQSAQKGNSKFVQIAH